MQELSVEQINIIEEEVNRSGVSFSHLREELIDHICSDIEQQLKTGLSFEQAYERIRAGIGGKGLRKVQENTLLLIDKKYRVMKKTMKISGLVSMSLMTIGAILKILHLPAAGLLLMFGFTLMALVFLPSAMYVMKKEISMKGKRFIFLFALIGGIPLLFGILFKIQHWPGAAILILTGYLVVSLVLIPLILISRLRDENARHMKTAYILGAVSISLYLLGDLFKIMHYPGAGPLLVLGAVLLTAVFLPIYGYKAYRNSSYVKGGFIYLCIGIFFFNLFNILLALNVSKDVLSYYIKPGEEILLTTSVIENQNKAIIERYSNDSLHTDTQLLSKIKQANSMSDELYGYIEKIKISLIQQSDGVSESRAIECVKKPELILSKAESNLPTTYMCGTDPDYNNGKATELKSRIELLRKELLLLCDSDKNVAVILNSALETTYPAQPDVQNMSWELYHFYNLPLIAVNNKLGFFQRSISIAKQEVLLYLTSKK